MGIHWFLDTSSAQKVARVIYLVLDGGLGVGLEVPLSVKNERNLYPL
jgi:hypothetical protein